MRWVSAQGLGLLGAYLAMPVIILPFMALWPSVGVLYLVRNTPSWLRLSLFCICFALCYGTFLWLVYLQPRGDYLVLHTRGFRLRITFKRREVLFDDLQAITFGLQSKLLQIMRGGLRVVQPGQARFLDEIAFQAMNLHYKNGNKTVFKQFLVRFEPEDTGRFLEYIAQYHPELCHWGTT
jgi:hypothetical protein